MSALLSVSRLTNADVTYPACGTCTALNEPIRRRYIGAASYPETISLAVKPNQNKNCSRPEPALQLRDAHRVCVLLIKRVVQKSSKGPTEHI